MSAWYAIFDDIDDSKLAAYLAVSLAAYLAFVFGTELGERRRPNEAVRTEPRGFNIGLMNFYLLLAGIMFIGASMALRGEFFKGYVDIETVEDLYTDRSIFSAVMSFTIALWILYTSMSHQKSQQSPVTASIFANRFLVLYLLEVVLSISMGSRYAVLSGLFMIGTYCSVYIKKWRLVSIGAYSTMALALALAVGALRAGFDAAQSVADVVFGGVAETLYGAFSLTYFLREYSLEVLRWPVFLLSDYIYLVPRILLPMKDSMILSPADRGFHIENPIGGVHSFFSFMVNFGALGSVFFLFLFFYGMGRLKAKREGVLARTVYSMISGWLLISFFRNPFEVSLVKDIFQMSILVPSLVLGSIYFIGLPPRIRTAPVLTGISEL